MKYVVPAAPTDPKPNMVDVTDMPEVLAAAELDHCFARVVPDKITGRKYMPTSDYKKLKGEDVEIPIA